MESIERTFICPDMNSQTSAIQVRQVLSNTPGIVDSDVSFVNRTVHVVLWDPQGEPTVRRHLANAGFPPED